MPDYSVSYTSLGSSYCPSPSTWNQILSDFAGVLKVTLPSITGIIVQSSTPSAGDQDKLWIKTDAAIPYVIGSYVYQGGDWRRVPGLPVYFTDTGSANTITLTTGESIANAGYITGRLFLIRLAATSTGATTITIDSLAAKALKKANDQDIASGEIEAGQLILVAYDSVSDNFELLTTLTETPVSLKVAVAKQTAAAGSNGQQVFSASAAAVAVTLDSLVDPGTSGVSLGANQLTVPAGTWLFDVSVPFYCAGADINAQVILYNVTDAANAATARFDKEGGGSGADHGIAVLKHPVVLAASKIFEIRVQAASTIASCYLGGNAGTTAIGSIGEVYTQVALTKLA